MRVYLKTDCNVVTTRHGDPNDRWDGDDTTSSWRIEGLSLKPTSGDSTSVSFQVEKDTPYYAVVAIYSTGDSFSHDEHGRLEFIDLFKSKEKAQKVADILRNAKKPSDFDWNVRLQQEDDSKYNYHVPWFGYFESLSEIRVELVELEDE